MKTLLPNLLTLSRLIFTPLAIWLYWRATAPLGLDVSHEAFFVALIFLLIWMMLTDFLDGFLARRWKSQSALGQFLDPLVDKVLVLACLAAILHQVPMQGYLWLGLTAWLALLARDILVTFWRVKGRTGAPSRLAKWKTAIEMGFVMTFMLGLPLVGQVGLVRLDTVQPVIAIGLVALAALSWWTALAYAGLGKGA
jgi:cardiolipin synthase (CMP-forming)